ncbi:MAG: hypothetical protein IK019_05700 [Clostridia bacterium]|nr:hypothetical protein [Clostridia bacterium]
MKKAVLLVLLAFIILSACASRAVEIVSSDPYTETIPWKIEKVPIKNGIYHVYGTQRLTYDCSKQYSFKHIKEVVEQASKVLDSMKLDIPVYFYFVESSASHPVAKEFPEDSDIYLLLKEKLHVDGIDHLKYSTYEEFCRYFYTTDHHWKYEGYYQGYLDIVRMLKGEDEEVLKPSGIAVFPFYYDGSFSRYINQTYSREKFAFYVFDPFPEYTSYINGIKIQYDHIQEYLNGTYSTKPRFNHYGGWFGGDRGLRVFEGEQTGKGTLLMIGNSQSNAIKTLLIHHYDRIVFISLRHYHKEGAGVGKPFSMKEIIDEYDPDQVLFIGCADFLATDHLINLKP